MDIKFIGHYCNALRKAVIKDYFIDKNHLKISYLKFFADQVTPIEQSILKIMQKYFTQIFFFNKNKANIRC